MLSTAWPAPAKLNLFLHITGVREDGYHQLQTLFQFLDYADSLDFSLRDDGQIVRLTDFPGVAEEDDLVIRAAKLLARQSERSLGVGIALNKILPLGGGLGGGSSDAATTLVALNQLWGLRLTLNQLAELALQLGADVPVFVRGLAAWAEGVGEQLTPVEVAEPWYLVVVPDCQVSTAEIFSNSQLTRDCSAIRIRAFLTGQTINVCQPVVKALYPRVAEALDWLSNHSVARLTGTGGCVFAAFEAREQAERIFSLLPSGWSGFVAKGCNSSLLLRRLRVEKTLRR
ncbi:MAG: 4-(cytidine 5'-diphospho)-2-C-methyl-D-erythritol kinase [Gammaproteobacteria bacterium]|nr:4-(cytidine 5'-diphospho)-2-C-methyl-D-erythritol kinase [Gammaproteobacteria bacterium]